MLLDSCSLGCGWTAGFIGCIGFGSFGVPLKGEATNSVDGGKGAHIFVLQTYKSMMLFITCWLVLLLGGSFHFSPMGLVSALLWVTGGAAGIFGIRNAGLAISVGTWSGVTVLVSFAFGAFAFGEKVHSVMATLCGIGMLLVGFAGMSYFSSPTTTTESISLSSSVTESHSGVVHLEEPNDCGRSDMLEPLLNGDDNNDDDIKEESVGDENECIEEEEEDLSQHIVFLGLEWNRRTLGILGAAADGFLGGSILIPMHYSSVKGLDYIISFGIGAAIVTTFYWILIIFYHTYQTGSFTSGYGKLPSMHLQTLLLPGVISGTTWSVGNLGNTLSVFYLGESVGMSVVQCQMIVSGLWGILWFGEIKGLKSIFGWMCSALVTLGSIMLLGREHVS